MAYSTLIILVVIAAMLPNAIATNTEMITELVTELDTDPTGSTNAPDSTTNGVSTDELTTSSSSTTTDHPTIAVTTSSNNTPSPSTSSSATTTPLSISMITSETMYQTTQMTTSNLTTDQTTILGTSVSTSSSSFSTSLPTITVTVDDSTEGLTLSSSLTTSNTYDTTTSLTSSLTDIDTNTGSTFTTLSTSGTANPVTQPRTTDKTDHTTEFVLTTPPTETLTTEQRTEPPIEPTTRGMTTKAKVGPLPEPTFPELDADADKIYQFEFAVEEGTAGGCSSDDLSSVSCNIFKYNITTQLTAVYKENDAFRSIEVILRPGSIIVSHNVTYSYNAMSDQERSSSAQSIYDQTLGPALADGILGNYSVIEECGNCNPPREFSTICDLETPIDCGDNANEICNNNAWQCESICDTDYCHGNGICWQEDFNSRPICSCDWNNNHWYWGYECQFYVDQMYLIIGCTCGGVVLIVLLVILCACLFAKTRQKSDKSKVSSESGDDVIHAFHNLGFSHDTETHFPPIDDIEEGDILQRSRPYSYIYSKPEDSANGVLKIQNGNNTRENELEAPVNEEATKRLSNVSSDTRHSSFLKSNGDASQERSPEFWGNLSEPSDAERIKLQPVLDHNVNEPFKIQRPRISANYSYGTTSTAASATPNVYQDITHTQSQYIPDPDYATQR